MEVFLKATFIPLSFGELTHPSAPRLVPLGSTLWSLLCQSVAHEILSGSEVERKALGPQSICSVFIHQPVQPWLDKRLTTWRQHNTPQLNCACGHISPRWWSDAGCCSEASLLPDGRFGDDCLELFLHCTTIWLRLIHSLNYWFNSSFSNTLTNWKTVSLTDWQIHCPNKWFSDRLTNPLNEWFINWLGDSRTNWLIERLSDWLTDWLTNSLTDWLIHLLVTQSDDWLQFRLTVADWLNNSLTVWQTKSIHSVNDWLIH